MNHRPRETVYFPVHTELSPFLAIQKLSRDIHVSGSNGKTPWVYPVYYGLDYAAKGRGIYEDTKGTKIEYGSGSIILIRPDCGLACRPLDKQPLEHLWIRFSGPFAETMFAVYNDKAPVNLMPSPKLVQMLLETMETCRKSCNNIEYIRTATTSLMAVLGGLQSDNSYFKSGEPYIQRFIKYCQQQVHESKFELKRFLNTEGVGFESFRKKLKKSTGFFPYDFWLKCKIDYAMNLLETTRMPIGEVAENAGFNDIYYFSAFFKKKTGLSPVNYRKKHSGSQSSLEKTATRSRQ